MFSGEPVMCYKMLVPENASVLNKEASEDVA